MITKIVFHLGGYYSAYDFQRFCTVNAEKLLEKGVLYPQSSLAIQTSFFCEHHSVLHLLTRGGDPALREQALAELCAIKNRYNEGSEPVTLVFSIPDISMHRNGPLQAESLSLLHSLLPQAAISAFMVLSRQDLEYEAFVTRREMLGRPGGPIPEDWVWPVSNVFVYDQFIDAMTSLFGEESCSILVDNGEDRQDILQWMMREIGIVEWDEAIAPVSPSLALLPQDILAYVHLYRAVKKTRGDDRIPDWSGQRAFFDSGALPAGFLSEITRKRFLARMEPLNARLAARFGCERLFSSEISQEWKPFYGFSAESAFSMASNLEAAFAEEFLHDISELPQEYKKWDLLMIEEGLRACVAKQAPQYLRGQDYKVSVLTMCYNSEQYIEDTIRGVLEQETNFPVEHIIHDDGSDDGSREIILDYAAKYPHITPLFRSVRNAPWEGTTVARIFSMAKSPYVSLCDGDDYFIDPCKLQRQVDFLEANPRYSICFHPVQLLWENKAQQDRPFPIGRELPPHGQPYTLTDLVRWNFMSSSSVMYRWRFQKGLPSWFYAGATPGDWYWHILHAEMGRIGMLPEIMSVYRRHDKGVWKFAETDLAKHKERFGVKEMYTYIIMDEHLKRRYHDIYSRRILSEFSILYELIGENENSKPFKDAVKEFPDWAAKILELVAEDE